MIEITDLFVYLICFGFIVTWVLISIGIFYKVDKLLKQFEVTDQQKERFLNKRGWRYNGSGSLSKGDHLNCTLHDAYEIEKY